MYQSSRHKYIPTQITQQKFRNDVSYPHKVFVAGLVLYFPDTNHVAEHIWAVGGRLLLKALRGLLSRIHIVVDRNTIAWIVWLIIGIARRIVRPSLRPHYLIKVHHFLQNTK